MKKKLQARLEDYIDAYYQTRQKVNNDAIAIALVKQAVKDIHKSDTGSKGFTSKRSNGERPASERQISYLYALGIREIPENLHKFEASNLILSRTETKPVLA